MTDDERKALEDAGYAIGDAEDFLGLDDDERRAVALKVFIARLPAEERAAIERRAAELIKQNDSEHHERLRAIWIQCRGAGSAAVRWLRRISDDGPSGGGDER